MIESHIDIALEDAASIRRKTRARDLRVLTIAPFYPNSENPAEGCFIAETMPFMARFGINSEVIAVRPFHRNRVQNVMSDIPCAWKRYFCLPGNFGLPTAGTFLAQSLAKSIQKIHETEGVDLIHAHAALPCGEAAERISRRLGIPFVVSVHGRDVFYERQAGKALGRWCRRVSERVYRRARAVICISEKVRACLGYAFSNTRVIYNGVDPKIFFPRDEQTGPPLVLSVGNLIPSKGHASLLRAFAQVLNSVPDCELTIIGDGPERGSLWRLAEQLGIAARVKFAGRRTRAEVVQAMQRCAVFALPSSYEGLGCVYLEAMACGKAAIGCEGQGIEEVIEHGTNGLLAPPGSEPHLVEALRTLLLNEEFRRRTGTAARKTILQRHTLEHQASELAQLYEECA